MILPKTLLVPLLLFLAGLAADGWLGVYLRDTDHAEIAEVIPGSPADKAGLRAGDRLLAVGDTETATRQAFIRAIRAATAGSRVRIRVQRGRKEFTVEVELGQRPADAGLPAAEPPALAAGEKPAVPEAETARPAGRPFLGLSLQAGGEGVTVAGLVDDGPAARAGVRVGERLVRCGDRRIRTIDDVEQVLAAHRPGDKLALGLRGERGSRSVLVTLGTAPDRRLPAAGQVPAEAPATLPAFSEDLAAASERARAEGRPLLVVFGASWNSASKAQRRAMADPAVAKRLPGFVVVWLDTDRHDEQAEKFGVRELPDLRILRGGEVVWHHAGYLPPAELAQALAGAGKAAAGRPPAGGELSPALDRVLRRLQRLERRLSAIEKAATELQGLQELRAELAEIRKLLGELRR